ncbi:MAG: response regulator transcription factor [Anaerolineales bacterium]|nr:response regulator transcription factor [Anaerolineales bacterium]
MIKILLVDDHKLFLDALASLINSQPDFSVIGTAGSVQEAIHKAGILRPDIVLMDFFLGDGTGLDATEAILKVYPSTNIVFLTVHEDDDRLFEAIRYGAKGYLLKSTPATEMLANLRGLGQGLVAINPKLTARIVEEFAQLSPRWEIDPEVLAKLTPRQQEILRELLKGATNRQIAARLVISEQTVKNHVSHILDVLHLKNRREVMRLSGHS